MASYTSPPVSCIFQGESTVPDKFVISYKADLSDDPTFATIQFKGILNDGSETDLTSAVDLDGQAYHVKILESAISQLIGFYWVISNVQYLKELNGIELVTKHSVPITATK